MSIVDRRILYNPLAVMRKGDALFFALVVIVVLTGVAVWGGVHLDGALDLHINPVRPSARLVIMESLIDWISLALMLFAASKVFKGNGGLVGHLAATGLARFPMIFAAIIGSRQLLGAAMLKAITVKPEEIVVRPQEIVTPALIIGGLVIVGLVAWSVVMLVFGFKEAGRLQGGKMAAAFVIGIILAEIISKLVLMAIMA